MTDSERRLASIGRFIAKLTRSGASAALNRLGLSSVVLGLTLAISWAAHGLIFRTPRWAHGPAKAGKTRLVEPLARLNHAMARLATWTVLDALA